MIKEVVSYFNSYYPTTLELDTCPHINLTSDIVWDPNSPYMENMEYHLTSRIAEVSANGDRTWENMPSSDGSDEYWENMSLSDVPDENNFTEPDDTEIFGQFSNPPELLDETDFAD
jgi:hypothetical protein